MHGANGIIFSTKVMKNCSATSIRALDIPFKGMIGRYAGYLCNTIDLDIFVQSSGGQAKSWLGVDGLSAPCFPNVLR